MFSDSEVNITTDGKRHLGAAIGSNEFRIKHVTEKVKESCEELKTLSGGLGIPVFFPKKPKTILITPYT